MVLDILKRFSCQKFVKNYVYKSKIEKRGFIMGNYFKELYEAYMRNINENAEDELKMIAEELGLEYKKPENKNEKEPKFGDVFFIELDNIPVYYIILDEEDKDIFKVAKVSEWWRLANQNDMLTEILGDTFIIEPWNKFFLTREEIEKSSYIDTISKEDKDLLKDFLEGKIEELPENKRGSFVPEGNYNFYQNKFHKKEAEMVKDYGLRIFEIIDNKELEDSELNIIELAPDRLKKEELAAGEENKVFIGENFTLFYKKEKGEIEFIPSENIIGKSAILKIFNEDYFFENLPEKIKLKIPQEVKDINIDYIGRNIVLEEK